MAAAMISHSSSDAVRIAVRVGNGTGTTGLSWLLGDHLGSTSLTVSATAVKTGELRYRPYGESRYSYGSTPTTFKFTGQREQVEIGLYYYQARWFDSALGRFVSADSIIPQPGSPLSWDRYLYARGNPLKYTDPSGHEVCDEAGNCYEKGKLVRTYKNKDTHPVEFFLSAIFRPPVRGINDDSPGFGQARGTYSDTNNLIYHPGVDLGNQLGLTIYAVAPGKVIYADYNESLGFTVIIEHSVPNIGLVYSIYAHLGTKDMDRFEAIFVENGDPVDTSTRIGVMGNTKGPKDNDEAIGTHLHFEIRTSFNVDKTKSYPLRGMQWWMNQDGGDSCSPWINCWLDLGILFGYDQSYNSEYANGKKSD